MRADIQTLAIRPLVPRAGEAPRRIVDELARRSLFNIFGRITRGSISVVEGDERFSFGAPGGSLDVTITVVDPAVYRGILLGGSLGAGEAYMKGLWTCEDLVVRVRRHERLGGVLKFYDRATA